MWSGRRVAVSRTLVIVVASALALTAALVGMSGGAHTPAPAHHAASAPSWAAKGAISSTLGRDQAAFHATHRPGGLIADNAAQRLTARFGSSGVLVRSGKTTFGLQLLAYGTAGHAAPVAPAAPVANANRVTYAHGAVTEWYVNGPVGLEQGFDVRKAPATTAGGQLAIVLGLRGNARAHADGHGGLALTGPGAQRLNYTGLSAVDARGRSLATTLTTDGNRAVIHVDTIGAVYPLRVDPFIQVAKFGDPNPATSANLGSFAIDVQGTTAIAAQTIPTVTSPPGSVDVFVANNGRWEQGATRVAQLTDPTDEAFGTSVALSADAKTIAVGAPSATVGMLSGEGKVYVFEQPAGGWTGTITTPTATLTGTPTGGFSDSLGKSVAISSDGSLVAGGAPGRASSAIDPNVGAVLVFARAGMHWTNQTAPQATLTHQFGRTGDQLGFSVALSGNGSTVVAGTPFFGNAASNLAFLGEAWVFQQPAGGWADNNDPNAVLLNPNAQQGDFFGEATAISDDAKTIAIGATGVAGGRGAVFVFTSPTGVWTSAPPPAATLTASDDAVGIGRSVATDGKVVVSGPFTVAVGGNMAQGAAYVFVEPAAGWASETQTQRLIASDGASGDGLGQTVAISNATVLASAPGTDAPGHPDAGSIYAFGSFPSTAISIAPPAPNGSNGWYVRPVSLAVSASDLDSNVTAIRCALDPSAAPIGFGGLPAACGFLAPGAAVSANGSHALFASAANAAGYAATPVSQSFKIDTVAPTVKCTPTPNFNLKGKGGLVAARVSDATSGAAAPIVAKRANVSRVGKKTLTLTGRDNAGNAANMKCRYTVVAPRLPTQFAFGFSIPPGASFTLFTGMTATKVPRGTKISISCKGGGCPFAHRTVKAPTTRLVCKRGHKHCKRKPAPALTNINLEPLLANHRFAPHAVLKFAATKPNTTSVTSTFTVQKGVRPTTTTVCHTPGAKKSFKC
jgi:trimeric autotransporter adhesin